MSEVDCDVVSRVAELDAILDNNDVDEVGITLDTSLPLIFHIDGKLGIAKTVLKPMFKFAIQSVYKLKFSTTIWVDEIVCKHARSVTRLVLLIKGDFPIAFDIRKQLIEVGALPIRDEIAFTSLLYTRHPKSPSGWHHRRWCLLRNSKTNSGLTAMEVETERELTRIMAEKHPKNYYAWMHRLWVIQYMAKYQLEDELYFTKTWLQSHVSDHSAVNHRIQIIQRILKQVASLAYIVHGESADIASRMSDWVVFVERMFQESEGLIWSRPGHEALWYLRRSLLEILLTQLQKALGSAGSLSTLGDASVSVEEVEWLRLAPTSNETNIPEIENVCEDVAPPSSSASTNNSFALLSVYLLQHLQQPQQPQQQQGGYETHQRQLVLWLVTLLQYEVGFARRCVEHTGAWDYPAQRAMAIRYAAFVLDRVAHHISRDIDVESGNMKGSSGYAGNTYEAQIIFEGSMTLKEALSVSAKRIFHSLQSEDAFTRIWEYKANQEP